jgi:hypothetical protein
MRAHLARDRPACLVTVYNWAPYAQSAALHGVFIDFFARPPPPPLAAPFPDRPDTYRCTVSADISRRALISA